MDWSGLRYWLDRHLEDATGELAYRVAMRALPFVSLDLRKTWSSKIDNEVRILSMLRALVTMRVANDRPDMELAPYLHQARVRLSAPHTFDYAGRVIRSACNLHVLKTRHQRAEELRKAIQTAKDGSQNIAKGYGQVPPPYAVNTWGEVDQDTQAISSREPLPEFALRDATSVVGAWQLFRENVIFYNEGWDSWVNWLDYRLFGKSTQGLTAAQWRTVELKLATAGDSIWSKPSEINAFFADALSEVLIVDPERVGIEDQNPNAILFVANDAGKIDLDRSPRDAGLPSETDPLFLEALNTAFNIVSENTENSATLLRQRVQKYHEALIGLHQVSGPPVLIVRGESLRILKTAYDSADDALELPPLTELARLRLDELVAQHNVLVGLHADLAAVDRLLQPDLDEELVSVHDLRRIINQGRKLDVLTAEAESALADATEQTSADSTLIHARRASESGKNLIRSALRELWKHKRSIGTAVVGLPPALYAIGRWAIANEAVLMKYFANNPGMHEAVIQIFRWLHSLPLL